MSFSDAQICNIALGRIGESNRIQNLDEDTPSARTCKDAYALARDTALAAADWPFAIVRSFVLAEISDDNNYAYTYVYAYPADALRLVGADDGLQSRRPEEETRFVTGQHNGQRVILSDEENMRIDYVARVTDPSLFSPLFVNALAWRLASDVAMPLTKRVQYQSLAAQQYEVAIGEALQQSLNDDAPPGPAEGSIGGART